MFNLCCIANDLKPQHKFNTMTWYQYARMVDAFTVLSARWLNNVKTTYHTIEHCHRNHWGYRVSSSLFPISTHPDFVHQIQDAPDYAQIQSWFDQIKSDNQQWGIRLSTHPDQFNVLASTNQQAVDKSIRELNQHGWLLDQLGCPRSYLCPINIHVKLWGPSYGQRSMSPRIRRTRIRLAIMKNGLYTMPSGSTSLHSLPLIDRRITPMMQVIESDGNTIPSKMLEKHRHIPHALILILDYQPAGNTLITPQQIGHESLGNLRRTANRRIDCDWDVELKDKEQAIRMLA